SLPEKIGLAIVVKIIEANRLQRDGDWFVSVQFDLSNFVGAVQEPTQQVTGAGFKDEILFAIEVQVSHPNDLVASAGSKGHRPLIIRFVHQPDRETAQRVLPKQIRLAVEVEIIG